VTYVAAGQIHDSLLGLQSRSSGPRLCRHGASHWPGSGGCWWGCWAMHIRLREQNVRMRDAHGRPATWRARTPNLAATQLHCSLKRSPGRVGLPETVGTHPYPDLNSA
jgi:hypothetical protein